MNTKGQTMMLAASLLMLLIISVPVIMFMNQHGSKHQDASQNKVRGLNIAEQGVAYAAQRLGASSTTWNNALYNGDYSAVPECTDTAPAHRIAAATGGFFSFTCANDTSVPNRREYQLGVKVTAWMTNSSSERPLKIVLALLSRKTLATTLTTGFHADNALVLGQNPGTSIGDYNLVVHWGPILAFNVSAGNPWSLREPLDSQFYPRKFSPGGIQGNVTDANDPRYRAPVPAASTSDQKEYWAYTDPGFIPLIDTATYAARARAVTGLSGIGCVAGGASNPTCDTGTGCGYFVPTGGCTVALNNTNFAYPNDNAVIYVEGDVQLDNLQADLRRGAIIAQNITLGARTLTSGMDMYLNVPPNAHLEYPYLSNGTPSTWPCNSTPGGMCNSTTAEGSSGKTNFRGFLWAKDSMTVTNATTWRLAGTVLVGDLITAGTSGGITFQSGSSLHLYYDDTVNHQILTRTVTIQTDSLTELAN